MTPTKQITTLGHSGLKEPLGRRAGKTFNSTSLRRMSYLLPLAVFLTALSLYPSLQMLRMSVSDVGIANINGDWPLVGFENFVAIGTSAEFWLVAGNTLIYVGVVLVLSLVVGFAAALATYQSRRTTRVVLAAMILVWAIPPVVSASLWKFLLAKNGAVNQVLEAVGLGSGDVLWLSSPDLAIWSVALVTAWVSIPFCAVVLRASMLSLNPELFESSELDGARKWQAVWYITIPMLRPAFVTLTILVIMYAVKAYDIIFVLTSGGPGTASMTLPYLGYQTAFANFEFGLAAATAVAAGLLIGAVGFAYIRETSRSMK